MANVPNPMNVDPGAPIATPAGTGRLGNPTGTGQTWGSVPRNGVADTSTQMVGQTQDGTGQRSR
jgi:hypothetical protein